MVSSLAQPRWRTEPRTTAWFDRITTMKLPHELSCFISWTKQKLPNVQMPLKQATNLNNSTNPMQTSGNIETALRSFLTILTSIEVLLPTPGSSIHRKNHTSKLRINMIFTAPVGSVAETAETKFLGFATETDTDGSLAFDSRDVALKAEGKWQHFWWPDQVNFPVHYFNKMFDWERSYLH